MWKLVAMVLVGSAIYIYTREKKEKTKEITYSYNQQNQKSQSSKKFNLVVHNKFKKPHPSSTSTNSQASSLSQTLDQNESIKLSTSGKVKNENVLLIITEKRILIVNKNQHISEIILSNIQKGSQDKGNLVITTSSLKINISNIPESDRQTILHKINKNNRY